MEWLLQPSNTYFILLCTQAAHLLHHRLVKRHISFAEVGAVMVLCIQPGAIDALDAVLPFVHLGLATVQIVGSVFIKRLSPDWDKELKTTT